MSAPRYHAQLREALAELYTIVHTRILGTGANPAEDTGFRQTCIAACTEARKVLDDTKGITNV